jgi:hypothetical protein
MVSVSFPALPPPLIPSTAGPSPVGSVAAVTPVALLQAELDALPLPGAQPAPVLPNAADGQIGAAMRPDQVLMSRQLSWPNQDGGALAASWRSTVQNYGAQVEAREQQARAGRLPSAVLMTGQFAQAGGVDARVLRQSDMLGATADAWRFTVHAGTPQDQHLRVVERDPEQQQNRRRRGRAALRLELVLADGSVVMVQAEPLADGVLIELCAPDAALLGRLRELEPQLENAIRRSGLRVLAWRYRDTLPDGQVHARLPTAEAASALSLPVFRAMAELALLLPRA